VGTVVVVWLDVLISQTTERYNTVIGVIFVLTVLFSPTGILGVLETVRHQSSFKFINRIFPEKKPQQE
jgi:ABC-type branched-subunit amino acid transport system permease subunit